MGADVLHGFQSMKPLLENIGQKQNSKKKKTKKWIILIVMRVKNRQINSKVNYELKIVAYIRC